MASGEMSGSEFTAFLEEALGNAAGVSRDGSVHFVCMDWRHIRELIEAGREVYGEMLNLVVWEKTNAGQGTFYRSAHELVGVFRVGEAKHLNNVELGRHGRSRSNVWHYAGVNTFRAGRMEELSTHPTVKPAAMVSDAIKDCTKRGDVVLDTFAGSGTTILASERVAVAQVRYSISPGRAAARRVNSACQSGRCGCGPMVDRVCARLRLWPKANRSPVDMRRTSYTPGPTGASIGSPYPISASRAGPFRARCPSSESSPGMNRPSEAPMSRALRIAFCTTRGSWS